MGGQNLPTVFCTIFWNNSLLHPPDARSPSPPAAVAIGAGNLVTRHIPVKETGVAKREPENLFILLKLLGCK